MTTHGPTRWQAARRSLIDKLASRGKAYCRRCKQTKLLKEFCWIKKEKRAHTECKTCTCKRVVGIHSMHRQAHLALHRSITLLRDALTAHLIGNELDAADLLKRTDKVASEYRPYHPKINYKRQLCNKRLRGRQ